MPTALRLTVLAAASSTVCSFAAWSQGGITIPGAVSRPPAGFASSVGGTGASQWVKGYNSAVRLVAGADLAANGGRRLIAGVEIRLADGWKTYWRHPGDDGGLPPTFDWAGSVNVKSQRVLYPAPERSKSLNGTTIGYSEAVIFPVEIEAADSRRAVELKLTIEYGICREICVPAEAKLALSIPADLATMSPDIAASLRRVPRQLDAAGAGKVLRSAKAVLSGASPVIMLEVVPLEPVAGQAGRDVDLFVEPPAGIDLPVPVRVGDGTNGAARFRIDLKGVEKPAALAGLPLRLTVKSSDAGSELVWHVR